MDNKKDDRYYLNRILSDLSFLIEHTRVLSREEFEANELLLDSVMFRLIQISESYDLLTDGFKTRHSGIPWRAMKGMKNRIVHGYGEGDLSVVYETVTEDLPFLHAQLSALL